MTHGFSITYRPHLLDKIRTEPFDLAVIGGGITGAGIALDAVSRGLRVVLLEKHDFAFGTSSRSTKLIHGGLRYLKQLEFGLVREVGSERAVVHRLAPHLVIPEKMLLPLSEGKSLGYWLTSVGLKVYDLLAGVSGEDQRRMLTRSQTLKSEPLLRAPGIKGGALYAEYRTDDARLTLEILKTAHQMGATIVNYADVREFTYENEKISGLSVTDRLRQEQFTVRASVVVNATGPWVDQLRSLNGSLSGKRLHLTKGVHVVVAAEKFPIRQAIYFDVADGRMIFAIPRGRTTYIGTTDTNYSGDQDAVYTGTHDAEYLINAVNAMFPSVGLSMPDIESSWAGLRPLIHEEGKSASELSRKDEIFTSGTGLISIAGGKLTGYRKMAERVVDLVIEKHFRSHPFKKCHTATIRLAGNAFENYGEVKSYVGKVLEQLRPFGFGQVQASSLVERYGQQTEDVLKLFKQYCDLDSAPLALLKAECSFCIANEMVITLEDFFLRRTGMINFDIQTVVRWHQAVADEFQRQLGWTERHKNEELASLQRLINKVRLVSGETETKVQGK